MNKRIVLALLGLVLVAGSIAWCSLDRDGNAPLTLYGNVDIREVELAFRQSGRLESMSFDEGERVQKGAFVATLDDAPFRDALAAAAADVSRARAELEKLERGNRPQEIAQAGETVRRAQAAYDNAEREFERQSRLFPTRATSRQELDMARTARDEAAASLAAARQALALQRAGFRQEDIAAGRARLEAALAAESQARTALADTRLAAPSPGTILARVREPGSMVTPGDPVYTLSLDDPVYVRAYVGEPDLGRIAPGDRVRLHTDSSDRAYEGRIGFISPRAEFTPKSVETVDLRTDLVYRLRIVVENADRGLRQGMPVTVVLAESQPGG